MDLNVPATLADSPVIIGGKYREDTYAGFQKEMDMINAAFAAVMMEGDARGRVFTFPIPTYNITRDFDWNNPNLENIWKMTGKYGIPYFLTLSTPICLLKTPGPCAAACAWTTVSFANAAAACSAPIR